MSGDGGGGDDTRRFAPHYRRALVAGRLNEVHEEATNAFTSLCYELVCLVQPQDVERYVDSLAAATADPENAPRAQA